MLHKLKYCITKETILYGLFGIITTIINIGLYQILLYFGMKYNYSNLITLVVTKLIAYILNKIFVFKSRTNNTRELGNEFFRYLISRGFTLVLDYLGLILLVDVFKFNERICKYYITILVVIINYFIGKKHVFIYKKNVTNYSVK